MPRPLPTLLVACVGACFCLWSGGRLIGWMGATLAVGDLGLGALALVTGIAWIGALASLVEAGLRIRRGTFRRLRAADYRTLAYVPFAALLFASAAQQISGPRALEWGDRIHGEAPVSWAARWIFLLIANGGLALWLRWRPREAGRAPGGRGALRALDLLAMNGLVLLLTSELLIAGWSRIDPSPLFFETTVEDWLESRRPVPHSDWFGARLSSRGYPDDEFFVAGAEDWVGVVLADSFGMGVVPRPMTYVSLAEATLVQRFGTRFRKLALHNFSVPSIGLAEYAVLYEREARKTRPSLVILSVFVGNDIHEGNRFGGRGARERLILQEWAVASTLRRALTLWRASDEELAAVARIGESVEDDFARLPHFDDPELEEPTFDEETFLGIEARRLLVAQVEAPKTRDAYRSFYRGLDFFRRQAGDRLVVLLIPDEFQVNDGLYARIEERYPWADSIDRFAPQREIRAFCEAEGIECVDVLPDLRAAERRTRTYHLRDSHLNAHGNRVVGRALAEAVARRIASRD